MTDLKTWLENSGYNRIFRILIKRTPGDWTPYEMEQKFSDESHYECDTYTFVKIKEAIELPNKDVLIGYQEIFSSEDLDNENPRIDYKKLSEIDLVYFPEDADRDNWY